MGRAKGVLRPLQCDFHFIACASITQDFDQGQREIHRRARSARSDEGAIAHYGSAVRSNLSAVVEDARIGGGFPIIQQAGAGQYPGRSADGSDIATLFGLPPQQRRDSLVGFQPLGATQTTRQHH